MFDIDLSPDGWRRRLRRGQLNIRNELRPVFESAIDGYERALTRPKETTRESLQPLYVALTHRSRPVCDNAAQMLQELTKHDSAFFDVLDDMARARQGKARHQVLWCLHRESCRERSMSLVDVLSGDRSSAIREKSYRLALLLEGRDIRDRVIAWLSSEKDAECLALLNHFKELLDNGFGFFPERWFWAFNRDGHPVQIILSDLEHTHDFSVPQLLAFAYAQTKPNISGHFHFDEDALVNPASNVEACEIVCMNCDAPVSWDMEPDEPCPHCGESTYITGKEIPEWIRKVSKQNGEESQ